MKKHVWLRLGGLCALILSVLCLAPFLYVLANSFRSEDGVTLTHYYTVFLSSPKYLLRFWLSLGLACCIAGGQVIVSALSGSCRGMDLPNAGLRAGTPCFSP